MTAIREIVTSDLKTETEIARSAFTVKMSGSAETAATTELDGFLKRLHQSAVTAKVPEVVIDIRGLEFMNSSCFKQFVTWISTLQESPADAQYRVRFIADEKKHWQSRSLGALACFGIDLIRIENR
jgi:hypothetical protein